MYLSEKKLSKMGFISIGPGARISDKASFYNTGMIIIGKNVRIDDYVIVSSGKDGIDIGDQVHIAPYSSLRGQGKITIENMVRVSSSVQIISSTDDFTGDVLPGDDLKIISDEIIIERKAVIGSGSQIMPGVIIGENSSVGALSLVKRSIPANQCWAGIPVKYIKTRKIAKAL